MKYLNLSEKFNPYNAKEKDCIKFELLTFAGGEPHIKIKYDNDIVVDESNDLGFIDVTITHRINSFGDLGTLLVAVDALKRTFNIIEFNLFLPYFPGARQDRPMIVGEPLTCKIYADIINNLKFHNVTIFDPHSFVTPALINNCNVINNHSFVSAALIKIGGYEKDTVIISPDAGSNKKIMDLAKDLSLTEVVKCDKERDVSTGKIKSFSVYSDDLQKKDCIIVDDICSNGGTFLGLAKELKKKNAGNLYLIVSHGEFGKDKIHTFKKLGEVFKEIYCTDSITTFDQDEFLTMKSYFSFTRSYKTFIKQIKLNDILNG